MLSFSYHICTWYCIFPKLFHCNKSSWIENGTPVVTLHSNWLIYYVPRISWLEWITDNIRYLQCLRDMVVMKTISVVTSLQYLFSLCARIFPCCSLENETKDLSYISQLLKFNCLTLNKSYSTSLKTIIFIYQIPISIQIYTR